MDGETIDILAAANNASEEVTNITKRSMNGELDFFESLTKRVKFLKGFISHLIYLMQMILFVIGITA